MCCTPSSCIMLCGLKATQDLVFAASVSTITFVYHLHSESENTAKKDVFAWKCFVKPQRLLYSSIKLLNVQRKEEITETHFLKHVVNNL